MHSMIFGIEGIEGVKFFSNLPESVLANITEIRFKNLVPDLLFESTRTPLVLQRFYQALLKTQVSQIHLSACDRNVCAKLEDKHINFLKEVFSKLEKLTYVEGLDEFNTEYQKELRTILEANENTKAVPTVVAALSAASLPAALHEIIFGYFNIPPKVSAAQITLLFPHTPISIDKQQKEEEEEQKKASTATDSTTQPQPNPKGRRTCSIS